VSGPRLVDLSAAPDDAALVGGKARALGIALRAGLPVPPGAVLTTVLFRELLDTTGLGEAIALELARKDPADLRWEELWDAAERIRALFLDVRLPADIRAVIDAALARFADGPLVVRSSAPWEDGARASFAGLHESVVGISAAEGVDAVREVWASLFSDRALLYRGDLGLDPASSAIAVVVQPLVIGEVSGVAFTRDPTGADRGVIEAVPGLADGLVSARVEPERWYLDRATGAIVGHDVAGEGPAPAWGDGDPTAVWRLARAAEATMGAPQDVEWTLTDAGPVLLQSRPVTTADPAGDPRRHFFGLTPSRPELELLRTRIVDEHFPAMRAAAAAMADVDLAALPDDELARETIARVGIARRYLAVYERDMIPFAHGMRLFGHWWARRRPDEPYGFVDLLAGAEADARLAAAVGPVDDDARALLELARVSRWARDEDNLLLDPLVELADAAVAAAASRGLTADPPLAAAVAGWPPPPIASPSLEGLLGPALAPPIDPGASARQLRGQPAGPGVGTGPAHRVVSRDDLAAMPARAVLVCDAFEPTFAGAAMRAAGIVERRGGMLVHGAIIAREYGIPCVTGVPGAVDAVVEGDVVTVDGYLGIVTIERGSDHGAAASASDRPTGPAPA
jgi:phosphohistidine swiveling domain-containing protein